MLNYSKWKKINKSYFGILGGTLGGPVTPHSIGGPIAQGNVDANGFRTLGDSFKDDNPPKFMKDVEDEDMEDEDMEDEDMEDEDEADMEDVEEMEDED